MTDIHIDDFYKDLGFILLRLYAKFPQKNTLFVEDISGPDEPDEFGLHSDRFMSCFSTMLWLEQEGYLTYESTIRQEAIDQAVLTHKGFMLLSSRTSMPLSERENSAHEEIEAKDLPASVLAQSQTNIVLLRNALNSRSSINIAKCVHHLLDS